MDEFLACLAKMAIAFSLILIILLFLIGGLLIWKPAILLDLLRYGIATICIVGGVAYLVQLLIALCRRK